MLEDHQVGHKSTMVEVEGDIIEQIVSILIEPGSNHNYITLGFVEICPLKNSKHKRSWVFQLATGTKKKISEVVIK